MDHLNTSKENIKKNIDAVLSDIKTYSPHPEKVKLVAVTKYFGPEIIETVLEAGINNVGENKGQVVRDKINYFKEKNIQNINWHFIGNLQKNKVKYIAENVTMIHSVNNFSLAEEINKKALQYNRVIDILLEINIAGEESKEGYKLEELLIELPKYFQLNNIKIKGLMTMAPYTNNKEVLRSVFSKLKNIKDELNKEYFNGELSELSMGMSGDYQIALEEGATLIRVGTKLYE